MKLRNKIFTGLGVLLAILILAAIALYHFGPERIAETEAQRFFKSKGIDSLKLKIDRLTSNSAHVSGIVIGNNPDLKISHLEITFNLNDLRGGKVKSIVIKKGELNIRKISDGMSFGELDKLKNKDSKNSSIGETLADLPFESLLVEDSAVNYISGDSTIKIPVKLLELKKSEAGAAGKFTGEIDSDKFSLKNGSGKLALSSGGINITDFAAFLDKGSLSSKKITIPLGGKPINFTLDLNNIDLEYVSSNFGKDKFYATGLVSGHLPISYNKGLMVHDGEIHSLGEGVLQYKGGGLPEAGNENVVMLSDLLEDFHYKKLILNLDSDEKNELSGALHLLGGNPKVYDNRDVQLNIKLNGDILSLIKQGQTGLNLQENLQKMFKK